MTSALLALSLFGPQVQDEGYMRLAHYAAGSHKPDVEAPGGFAPSDNFPSPVHSAGSRGLLLLSLTDKGVVKLANHSPHELTFKAQDSNLPLVMEAKNSQGEWRPVEFMPPATCGNSFHRLFLPPRHEWTFQRPLDEKGMKTKLRIRISHSSRTVYSNEIDGVVNVNRFVLSPQWSQHYELKKVDDQYLVVMKR